MSVEYFAAPNEVDHLVTKIRKRHYPKFHKAGIVILMRSGKWDKYGTIARVSKKQRLAGINGDYILTFNADEWPHLDKKQRQALVDHELYHMVRHKTKKGTQFKLRHHYVEEFIDIVKRYGTWRPSLVGMKHAMKGK
jgi:hypothetical protein